MATEREFKLVGSFDDQITKKLKKINSEVGKLSKSFDRFNKRLAPVTKGMNKFADASMRANKALKDQKVGFESSLKSARQYTTQMRKAYSTAQKLSKVKPPKAIPASRAQRGVGGGGRGGRGGGGMAAGVAGGVAGVGLGNMMTNAVVSGFRLGTDIMKKPFEQFGRAFAERVGDEMQDIQSAGGMFALDQKNAEGKRLFKGFADARGFQEVLNRSLAKSAAALPGATNDYVRAARGLTDTVMMSFGKNEEAFKGFAVKLGADPDSDSREALTKVLSRFTEQTVLLGQGQTGGMPLTMLMEQLVTQEQVNVEGMKKRYAAMRQNPLLSSMLQEAQASMNATGAGTAERFEAVMEALDNALPQEVITAMKKSVGGVQEAIRSSFLDPDTGLLGLGRELDLSIKAYDDYGNVITKNGKVVKENTTLFKMFRDTLAGFLLPLSELASVLPTIFDPLKDVAESFVEVREISQRFLLNFNRYTNWFKDNDFEDAGARGALAALNKLLKTVGAIGSEEALTNAKFLESGGGLGAITKRLFTQLFDSEMMGKIGSALGKAIGSTLSSIASLLSGATDIATAGPLAKGFSDAFSKAGGPKAMTAIFKGVFELFGKALLEVFKAAPLEVSLLAGLALLPTIIASAIGGLVTKVVGGLEGRISTAKVKQGVGLNGDGVRRRGKGGSIERLNRMRRRSGARRVREVGGGIDDVASFMPGYRSFTKNLKGGNKAFTKGIKGFSKLAKPLNRLARVIPGGAILGGAADFAMAKASGESTGKALVGTFGAVLGGAVGSIFGPAGTVIGSIGGSIIGDKIYDKFNPSATIQKEAAQMQLDAAEMSKRRQSLEDKLGISEQKNTFGSTSEFKTILEYAGFGKNEQSASIIKEYKEREEAFKVLEQAQAEYERTKEILRTKNLSEEKYNKGLEVHVTKVKNAAAAFETENKEFASKFKELPTKMTDAMVSVVKTGMTFTQLDAAIADKIRLDAATRRTLRRQGNRTSVREDEVEFYGPAANYYGDYMKPLMDEMRNKPIGSKLSIANSSETILNQGQTSLLASALNSGSGTVNNYNTFQIDGSKDPDAVAEAILNAMQQMEAATIA